MNARPQIMVIDDDAIIGKSFERVLTPKGYDVSSALSGHEALDDIHEKQYDVIFTDIKMPEMDGFEVAKQIKELHPNTPVVFITGFETKENKEKAIDLGILGVVSKPLSPFDIEIITKRALQTEVVESDISATKEVLPRLTFATRMKNIGLFFAAPFIGLAYVTVMPVVLFVMLAKVAYQAYTSKNEI